MRTCLFSAGSNARGQLATGDRLDSHRFSPCVFSGSSPGVLTDNVASIEHIACGANHTLVLLRRVGGTTELWGCGDGGRGQLGGIDEDAIVFRPIDLVEIEGYTVRLIAAGWETSYVVLSCAGRSDIVLSMGADDFGNLGVGRHATPKTVQSTTSCRAHIVDLCAALTLSKSQPEPLLTVSSLSAGPHHTVAHVALHRPDDGNLLQTALVGWGTSRHGQPGPLFSPSGRPVPFVSSPHIISPPVSGDICMISLGNQHTTLLRLSGELSGIGSNRKGQLDGLDALREVAFVGCTWNGTYVLLRTGTVVATGNNTHSQLGRGQVYDDGPQSMLAPVQFPFNPTPGQISRLACGSEHVLCIVNAEDTANREVWGWGWNEHGNLGIGGTHDVSVPVRIWPPSPSSCVREDTSEELYGNVVDVWAGCGTS